MNSYKLIWAADSIVLGTRVSEHLQHGWDLYGQPWVTPQGTYYQAMTHKEVGKGQVAL